MLNTNKNTIINASVVVVAYNESRHIARCLEAIFEQSYAEFELIVINDGSTDGTEEVIRQFNDNRMVYLKNQARLGIPASRNLGIKTVRSNYVFFTDADCEPAKNWLEEGVKAIREKGRLGVEGRTFYETAWTSLEDCIIENTKGGAYNTCNIGYQRSVLNDVGGFNEEYRMVSEDTDIALKVMKKGTIDFVPSMVVVHQKKILTLAKCWNNVLRVFSKIKYIKDTGDTRACFARVMYPAHLLYILIPPLLLLRYRIKNLREVFLLFVLYLSFILERLFIWAGAIKEGIFLL